MAVLVLLGWFVFGLVFALNFVSGVVVFRWNFGCLQGLDVVTILVVFEFDAFVFRRLIWFFVCLFVFWFDI